MIVFSLSCKAWLSDENRSWWWSSTFDLKKTRRNKIILLRLEKWTYWGLVIGLLSSLKCWFEYYGHEFEGKSQHVCAFFLQYSVILDQDQDRYHLFEVFPGNYYERRVVKRVKGICKWGIALLYCGVTRDKI